MIRTFQYAKVQCAVDCTYLQQGYDYPDRLYFINVIVFVGYLEKSMICRGNKWLTVIQASLIRIQA